MSAVIGALRADLSASIADFASGFSQAADKVKSFSDKFQKAGKSMQDFGGSMSLWVSAPLALVAGSMVKSAMAAEEMQSAFGVSFGAMASDTEKWAQTVGDAMGRSTYELQEGATAFNGLFKAGGPATAQATEMAKQFTVLAQDLASFFDMNPEEALGALRSGLSGEAEPLRRFNVYLTEGSVKAEAYAMGLAKAGAELTEQQKIQARASLIMKGTQEAQGDVIRTGDSATNTVRSLQSAWNELSVTLGSKILPVFTPIVGVLQKVLEGFSGLNPQLQTALLVFGGIAIAAGPIIVALGSIVTAVGALIPVVMGLAGALGMTAGAGGLAYAIGFIVGAVAPFVAAFVAIGAAIYVFREQIAAFLSSAWAAFKEALGPSLTGLLADVKGLVTALGATFKQVWGSDFGTVVKGVMGFLSDLAAIFGKVFGEVIGRALAVFVETFRGLVRHVTNVVSLIAAVMRGDWKGAWDAAVRILTNVVDTFLNVLDLLLPGAKEAVLGMVNAVRGWFVDKLAPVFAWIGDRAGGVMEAFGAAFRGAVDFAKYLYEGVKGWVQDRLGPLIEWAANRIRDLRAAFGQLASESKAPGAPAAAPAAAAPAAPAPRAPAAPPAAAAPAGGGRGGGGGRANSDAAKAAKDYAEALADLKEKLDPVSAALAAYNETLGIARRGGVDMTAATNLLAREAVDAAGGWEKLKDRLDTLPPAVAAAARAMRMDEIKDSVQALADMANPLAAAVREYTDQMALAKEGGLDLARVEPVVAQAAFEAAGGLEVWRKKLSELPPALKAAADAALAAEGTEYRADLMETGRQLNLTYNAQLAYNEEVRKLRELLDAGAISQGTFQAAMEDAGVSFQRHLADTNPAIRARFDAIDATAGALSEVANGTKTWQDAWKDLMQELLRILIIQPIIDRLKKSMMNFATPSAAPAAGGGGGSAGTFLNIASSVARIFGGFRAEGGPVVPGRMYMVGEEGPEPFIPKTSGTILPHGSLGDGGPVAPSITVYAPDALTSAWIKGAITDAYHAAVRDGASAAVQVARSVIPEEMARNAASSFV